MAHDASWQRLIDQAGEGRPPADDARHMSLASAAGQQPGASGDLKHSASPWETAARIAGEVKDSTDRARTKLQTSHEAIAREGEGLAAIAALSDVRSSWETRLQDASKECASLGGKLRGVTKAHGKNDAKVGSAFAGGGAGR